MPSTFPTSFGPSRPSAVEKGVESRHPPRHSGAWGGKSLEDFFHVKRSNKWMFPKIGVPKMDGL